MAFLEARGVVKRFGPRAALDGASISAEEGRMLAVLGENGAGKTTLMRVLSGELSAEEGSIVVGGWTWQSGPRKMRSRPPVALVHQHPVLADELTVAENVFLGREPLAFGSILRRASMREMARKLARDHGIDLDPDARAGSLSFADRQRTELLRALSHGPKVLILDEPSSHLSEEESERLFDTLSSLERAGLAVVLVTHRIGEALRRADSFMVMREGKTVYRSSSADEDGLMEAMFGERSPVEEKAPESIAASAGKAAARIEALSCPPRSGEPGLRDVGLEVRRGSIHCVLSIAGNGERALEDAISGMSRASSGSIRLDGTEIARAHPSARRKRGMSYVPRERMKRGINPDASIADNVLVHDAEAYRFPGAGAWRREKKAAASLEKAGISAIPSDPARTLSGGQVQRLVVERELLEGSPFTLMAEPTWGMDARRSAECHERIRTEAALGRSFLVILSQIKEALVLAHEISVLSRGRLVFRAVNDGSKDLEDRIRGAMSGGGGA